MERIDELVVYVLKAIDVPSNKVSFNPKTYSYTRRKFISAIYDNNHNSNKDIVDTRKQIFDDSNNITDYKRETVFYYFVAIGKRPNLYQHIKPNK